MENELQIIATDSIPVRTVIARSLSTVLINLITWNAAFSIFPLDTFQSYKGFRLHSHPEEVDRDLDILLKYQARGWDIQPMACTNERQYRDSPMQRDRRLGDKFTWKISFESRYVKRSRTPDFVIEHAHFSIVLEELENRMYCEHFKDHCFQYRYTYGEGYPHSLDHHCPTLTLLGLKMLKAEDRPTEYYELLERPTEVQYDSFERPDHWTYWDSEIPKWVQAWESELREDIPGEEMLNSTHLLARVLYKMREVIQALRLRFGRNVHP